MMNKAFIFDMDGVIVDSEIIWQANEPEMFRNIFGEKIAAQIGDTTGYGIDRLYEIAVSFGYDVDKQTFLKDLDVPVLQLYEKADITEHLEYILEELRSMNYKLGIVSASRQHWIEHVLGKFSKPELFECVISLDGNKALPPKPAPDGYLSAIERLGSDPKNAFILEDSDTGLRAAKASGAFTIAYTGNLRQGYKQTENPDAYANTMLEVLDIVKNRI